MLRSTPPNERAAICAFAQTPASRYKAGEGKKVTPEYYLIKTFQQLLHNSGLCKKDIDQQGLAVSRMIYPHQPMWSSEVAQLLNIRPRLLITSDHGGASAIDILVQSTTAVEKGLVDLVVCLGVDVPISENVVGLDPHGYIANYENPSGIMGPNSLFAIIMRRHMKQYGTRPEQIGRVTVDHRVNGERNPLAYLRKRITIEDYLRSKLVSDPVKVLDCCIPVNQGLGFIVCNRKLLRDITDKPVYLIGSEEEDGFYYGDPMLPDITYTGIFCASHRLFQKARTDNSKFDFLQLYDDYAIVVLMQLEDLKYCKKGKGGSFMEATDTTSWGDLPINTGGGQLSSGQPGLAGGFVHLVEAVVQLRGEASGRQVKDPKTGCVTGLGGIAYGRAFLHSNIAILSS